MPAQSATMSTSKPEPLERTPTPATGSAQRWETLLETQEAEPLPAHPEPSSRKPPWLWPAVAIGVLLLAFLAVWASGVIKVKTPEGYIVLKNLPDQAMVLVDDKKVTVRWPDGGGPAEITVVPGDHKVQVNKDGFTMKGQTVTVEAGGRTMLMVQLEPLEAPRPGKDAANNRPFGSEVAGPPLAPVDRDVTPPTRTSPPVQDGNPISIRRSSWTRTTGTPIWPDVARTTGTVPAIDAAIALRGKAEIVSGSWLVEGGELVQTDAGKFGKLLFGDLRWTDYDFTVELMREKGLGDTGLFFHRTLRNDNQIWFGFGVPSVKKGMPVGSSPSRMGRRRCCTAGLSSTSSTADGIGLASAFAATTSAFAHQDGGERRPHRSQVQSVTLSIGRTTITLGGWHSELYQAERAIRRRSPCTLRAMPGKDDIVRARWRPKRHPPKVMRKELHTSQAPITNSIGMTLTLIPAGEFMMGSPGR